MPLPSVAVSQSPEERFREFLASRPKPQRFTEQQGELVRHIFEKHSHFDPEVGQSNLSSAGAAFSLAIFAALHKIALPKQGNCRPQAVLGLARPPE